MHLQPEGYGIDTTHADIRYVPEDTHINLHKQTVTWENAAGPQTLQLQPDCTYVLPSGYKIEMVKPTEGQRWRLVGTNAEGTFCHKPCTVSGGGKSEISKSLSDAMIAGPMIVHDLAANLEAAAVILDRDFADRYKKPLDPDKPSRPLLDPERSLGSVIRLLTHNASYTDSYNQWLSEIPRSVRDLVFVIKRFHKPSWGKFSAWKDRFSVDLINGQHGNALAYRRRRLVTQYLRVGFTEDGTWRTFSLRKDFAPALKIQTEDDISASTVVPADAVEGSHPELTNSSLKFITNCEYRLFQRPDDAVIRGYDKKTESDFSHKGTFFSNYEPIDRPDAKAMVADAIRFEAFTGAMQHTLSDFADASSPDYVISSHLPRIVDGKPTKNPRYLQNRLDLENPRASYLANVGARFYRRLSVDAPVPTPVNAVLTGRRNNPADPEHGIRPLAVYGPVHYQELPELFMDFVASLTGKSPSTTGAGSEGALTKGPFNALLPVHDLNAALVSFILTGYDGFSSAAGHIGRKYRFDHDISLLVPEVWSRMFIKERDPAFLIENGYLEKIEDFEHDGKTVHASRLGYRINESFVGTYFGRVFSAPDTVFSSDMLRPEKQSVEDFADGINNITETQQRVAANYFKDGSVDLACPPLKALLHIMAHGDYEGKTESHPDIRALFTHENLISSSWYAERLDAKAKIDRSLWQGHVTYLTEFLEKPVYQSELERLKINDRLAHARTVLEYVSSTGYREKLNGTLGTDTSLLPPDPQP
ncbi:MAG: hypothetical protein P8J87_11405 [Verrucomicrobiales bacterium]|nr:hypothetical protein [Verrucomicrobiales bacterium]